MSRSQNKLWLPGVLIKSIYRRRAYCDVSREKVNKNSSTGITGVGIYRNKRTGEEMYRAYITVKRRQIALGLYSDINDAIAARKAAEEKYFEPLQERVDAIKDTLKNNSGKNLKIA